MDSLLQKVDEKHSRCKGDKITVRHLREWLATLPEEFQDAEFDTLYGRQPVTLKRIVAVKSKDGSVISVCANGMGSHFPFDETYVWHHVLS